MTKDQATKNIRIQKRINIISGIVFLLPVITLLYQQVWLSTFEIVLLSNIATTVIWLFELPTSVLADTLGRKRSLLISVVCNFLSAFTLFLFPTFVWFIVAAVFAALYRSFWSGTWQAFLEENLNILGKKKEFWKTIGDFMFWENNVKIILPVLSWLCIKYFWDYSYTILAWLDVVFAWILIYLTYMLYETNVPVVGSIKVFIKNNINTARDAFASIFSNKKIKLLLFFRTFWNHISLLPLLLLPLLVEQGMPDWIWWIVLTISAIFLSFSYKISNYLSERFSYTWVWLGSVILQAFLLIIIGFVWWLHWTILAILFCVWNMWDGGRQPARNHLLVHAWASKAIATTRSIIFAIFALRTTLWKYALSYISPFDAFFVIWAIMLCSSLIFWKYKSILSWDTSDDEL